MTALATIAVSGSIGLSQPAFVLLAAIVVLAYVLGLLIVLPRWARRDGGPAQSKAQSASSPGAMATLSELETERRVRHAQDLAVPAWASARGRTAFLALSAVVAIGLWGAAAAFSPDLTRFLSNREWHAQPLYLFAHAATVRIFASLLTNNYIAGVAHLDLDASAAVNSVRRLLTVAVPLGAVIVAIPLAAMDLGYFLSGDYAKLSGTAVPAGVDWLMFGIWSVEWLLNAMVWMMLAGFLWLNVTTLNRYSFRAPILAVLAERHYRPFLRMSAQGATVVFAFSLATAAYIVYAGGAVTDYVGLIVSIALLPACFVPPWIVVRRKVDRLVDAENQALHAKLRTPRTESEGAPERELSEAAAMLRLLHIERLHDSVGRREAAAIVMRLVAPAATIGWQLYQNGGQILQKVFGVVRGLG